MDLGLGIEIGMPFIRPQTGAAPQSPLALHTLFGGTHHWFFNPDHTAPNYVANTTFEMPDISGQGVTCINNSATCPVYTPAEATINNRPMFSGDGSARWVPLSWNPPAPATTNVWWYIIARQNAWAVNGTLVGSQSGTNMNLQGTTSTPNVAARNGGTLDNIAMTLNTWFRIMVLFTGVSGNDKYQVGSTAHTGLNLGNTNASSAGFLARNVAGVPGSSTYGNFSIALAYARVGEPSGALIAEADAQAIARYGAGIQV